MKLVEPYVQEFADQYELSIAEFDLCCFGSKTSNQTAIKGSRVILTNLHSLCDDLGGKTCAGGHHHADPSQISSSVVASFPARFVANTMHHYYSTLEQL